MNKKQRAFLVIFGVFIIAVIAVVLLNILMPKPEIKPDDIEVSKRNVQEQELPTQNPKLKTKEYVNIYFIGKNSNDEEVYKAVRRTYKSDVDGSRIKFAVYALIAGPKPEETQLGVYTEIPNSAQVISISEQSDRVIVNLNSSFVNGGGADSLYKRLYQLIKTVKLNSQLPVYLYIDGHKADVIGGEGIMLSQPLGDNSLEN